VENGVQMNPFDLLFSDSFSTFLDSFLLFVTALWDLLCVPGNSIR
jgi:hypothetical protein